MDIAPGTHACLVYADEASRRRSVASFLAFALGRGGCVRYFEMDDAATWMAEALERAEVSREVSVEAAACERLQRQDARSVYVPDGRFDVDRMLGNVAALSHDLGERCNGPVHICGEMGWALDGAAVGAPALVDYERRVNDVIDGGRLSAVCQYDAKAFTPDLIYAVVRVHPYLIIDGAVVVNTLYTGWHGHGHGHGDMQAARPMHGDHA
jgi:hypothetical protein